MKKTPVPNKGQELFLRYHPLAGLLHGANRPLLPHSTLRASLITGEAPVSCYLRPGSLSVCLLKSIQPGLSCCTPTNGNSL